MTEDVFGKSFLYLVASIDGLMEKKEKKLSYIWPGKISAHYVQTYHWVSLCCFT